MSLRPHHIADIKQLSVFTFYRYIVRSFQKKFFKFCTRKALIIRKQKRCRTAYMRRCHGRAILLTIIVSRNCAVNAMTRRVYIYCLTVI